MVKKGKAKRVIKHRRTKGTKMIKRTNGISNHFKNFISNTVMSRKLHMPMPDGYRTTLKVQWTAVETLASPVAYQYYVKANNPWLPFYINNGNYFIGPTTLTTEAPGTAVDQPTTIDLKNPSGLTRLYNPLTPTSPSSNPVPGIYGRCHVMNSKISIRCSPYAIGDSFTLAIAPQVSSESGPFTDTGTMQQAPRCRYGTMKSYNLAPNDRVHNSVNIPELLGMTPSEYISDPNSGINVQATSVIPELINSVFWVVRRCTLDNAVTSSPLPYVIELEYDCVFSQLLEEDIPVL